MRELSSAKIRPEVFPSSDESEEDIIAHEERWDAQFAATKKMADKVRADIRAGRTMQRQS